MCGMLSQAQQDLLLSEHHHLLFTSQLSDGSVSELETPQCQYHALVIVYLKL